MIMIFLGWKMFFIWAKRFCNHLTKIRWSFEFFLNEKLLSNKGFLKTFIKLLVQICTNVQLCVNFIFMILVIYFKFEAQIIYIWSLK